MTLSDVAERLKAHPFTQGLSPDHLQILLACTAASHFQPGQFVIREGAEADALFLIESGRIALEVHDPRKGAIQLEHLCPGDILGLSWLHPPARWEMDGRVMAPADVLIVSGPALLQAMDADPVFGCTINSRILAVVLDRLQRVRRQRLDVYQTEP
jgi:CRP-like cAMP-binding protein